LNAAVFTTDVELALSFARGIVDREVAAVRDGG
jgi:hypothetical protein